MRYRRKNPGTTTALVLTAALALTAAAGCSSKAKDDDGKTDGKGAAAVQTGDGVTSSVIPLGALTDLSGPYATLGKSVTLAQQLYVKQVNAKGGICHRKLKLTVKDHGYDPQRALSAYQELEPKVLGFPQFIGSPMVSALKQRIDGEDKGLVIPQAWSAHLLGSRFIRQIGTTYDYEMINAVDFLLKEKKVAKGDKVGHVYFEGDYGENALQGSKYAAKQAGLTIVEQKIKPTDTDMTAQVTALRKAGVKAVLLSAGPQQAASLTGVAAASGLNVPVVGNAPTFAPQLLKTQAAKALLANFYTASPVLPIGDPAPGTVALAKAYAKAYPDHLLDQGVIAGYVAMQVFGESLKAACKAKDLTRAGVADGLETLQGYDGGFGIKQDFSSPDKPSSTESYILRPSAKEKGGMSVYKQAFTAKAAAGFKQ